MDQLATIGGSPHSHPGTRGITETRGTCAIIGILIPEMHTLGTFANLPTLGKAGITERRKLHGQRGHVNFPILTGAQSLTCAIIPAGHWGGIWEVGQNLPRAGTNRHPLWTERLANLAIVSHPVAMMPGRRGNHARAESPESPERRESRQLRRHHPLLRLRKKHPSRLSTQIV